MRPKNKRPQTMTREYAEAIGLKALLFVAEDEQRLVRFLGDSGLDPGELRSQAGTPELQAAILRHLLDDESALLVFTANAGIDPAEVHGARAELGGADPWDSM